MILKVAARLLWLKFSSIDWLNDWSIYHWYKTLVPLSRTTLSDGMIVQMLASKRNFSQRVNITLPHSTTLIQNLWSRHYRVRQEIRHLDYFVYPSYLENDIEKSDFDFIHAHLLLSDHLPYATTFPKCQNFSSQITVIWASPKRLRPLLELTVWNFLLLFTSCKRPCIYQIILYVQGRVKGCKIEHLSAQSRWGWSLNQTL